MSEHQAKRRYLDIGIAWAGTFAACVTATCGFYDLHGMVALSADENYLKAILDVVRFAFIATFFSLWALWWSVRRRRRSGVAALWAGVGVLITLALYGVGGCGGVLGDELAIGNWRWSMEFFFPSFFFSEFNFLTFIFEVAPVTAMTTGVLVYFLLKYGRVVGANSE